MFVYKGGFQGQLFTRLDNHRNWDSEINTIAIYVPTWHIYKTHVYPQILGPAGPVYWSLCV